MRIKPDVKIEGYCFTLLGRQLVGAFDGNTVHHPGTGGRRLAFIYCGIKPGETVGGGRNLT